MARYEAIYHAVVVRTPRGGRQRHLFRGTGVGYPRSLCGDAQGTPLAADDVLAAWCSECRLVAVTELAMAVNDIGLHRAAIVVGAAVRELSFETGAAMTG